MRRPPKRRYQKNWQLFALLNIGGAIFVASLLYKTSDLNRSRDGCRIILHKETKFRPSPSADSRKRNGPEIALLISFPNSGTSFTLRQVRSVTRFGTATNYAKESKEAKITNYTGAVPTIQGGDCIGCSLPMPHDSDSPLPKDYVLVKTHCAGFQSQNWNETGIVTTKVDFLRGCVTPYHFMPYNNTSGRVKQVESCPYEPSLVKRVVHIVRNPLDNVVSRFHLYQRNLFDAQTLGLSDLNVTADETLPRSAKGFRTYCKFMDGELMQKDAVLLRDFYSLIPCLSEFFLYIQWHNHAFHVTSGSIPTHIFYYEDYSGPSFNKTSDAILNFLHLQRSPRGRDIPFLGGKTYAEYYTGDEKHAINRLIDRFASKETKDKLRMRYDLR